MKRMNMGGVQDVLIKVSFRHFYKFVQLYRRVTNSTADIDVVFHILLSIDLS